MKTRKQIQVCIIGAGPAGLMSAIFASQSGAKVVIIEKNSVAGKKLLLTAGGRCNLTHSGAIEDFVKIYGKAGRFLRHSLYELSPDDTRKCFSQWGLETKVDEQGCVFPVSEKATDVRDTLVRKCRELNAQFLFSREIERLEKRGDGFAVFTGKEIISADKVIIATGGQSFPQTGSTGDGYKLAKLLSHTIIESRPALVPLLTEEKWTAELAGTSLERVKISAAIDNKKLSVEGPMLFTHNGIGGPAVLDLSRLLADYLPAQKPIQILLDIVPAMNEEKLEQYLLSQLSQYSRKIIVNVLFDLIPKKLAGCLCRRAQIAETKGYQFKKEQRRQLIQLLKKLPLSITAARSFDEAVITRGGIALAEIDSKTMQSKICPGLYFAGEIIDADGPCGGYSLQICWSTGALAGKMCQNKTN
jgi:predicted Rossmann fold flavoprotein